MFLAVLFLRFHRLPNVVTSFMDDPKYKHSTEDFHLSHCKSYYVDIENSTRTSSQIKSKVFSPIFCDQFLLLNIRDDPKMTLCNVKQWLTHFPYGQALYFTKASKSLTSYLPLGRDVIYGRPLICNIWQ